MSTTPNFSLTAQARDLQGKGASRRLRHQQLVPAVIYGNNTPAVSISIPLKDISKSLESEAFYSHILSLNIDGKTESVILKALQRHPVKGFAMHADFYRVDATHTITLHVPLHYINQETCVGVKQQGGKLLITATDIEVETLPGNLPEFIEVDLLNVQAGTILHVSDIKLPEGVTIPSLEHLGRNQPIASVSKAAVDTDAE